MNRKEIEQKVKELEPWYHSINLPYGLKTPGRSGHMVKVKVILDNLVIPIEKATVLDIGCNCYSDDTEVLTIDGWKLFSDIQYSDKIATLNSGGYLEYNQPTKVIYKYYNGKMFSQSGKNIDLLVTPNHRMYVKPAYKNVPFRIIEAKNVLQHIQYKRDVKWSGESIDYFYLTNDIKFKMDVWLRFFGIWIAEGWVKTNCKKGNYSIGIAQNLDGKARLFIENTLHDMNIRFYKGKYSVSFCNKNMYLYLKQFGKAKDKFIPKYIKSLSREYLKVLLDAYLLGDGSLGRRYWTVSKKLSDDIQEISIKLGYACTISKQVHNKKEHNDTYRVSITGINSCKRTQLTPNPNAHIDKRRWINYTGNVGCVTVKNGIIYVRRNGKSCWSGNSGGISIELARRGAIVTGIDFNPRLIKQAQWVARVLGVNVKYRVAQIEDIKRLGEFDIVICAGVVYHLRYPMLALDLMRKCCKSQLYIFTALSHQKEDVLEWYFESTPKFDNYKTLPTYEESGAWDWWFPSESMMIKMMKVAKFSDIKTLFVSEHERDRDGVKFKHGAFTAR